MKHLRCETLVTGPDDYLFSDEKTISGELKVFIPIADYTSINGNAAYTDNIGLDFIVTLNPYIQYERENYTPKENLEYYADTVFDEFYNTSYKDFTISEVEQLENGARVTANYCIYDKWNDIYIPVYCTYFLTELSNDEMVLVEIEVNLEDATQKTEEVIAELEAFYNFDIEWDAREAQKRLDNFLENANLDLQTVTTGFLMFDLPADWERDYNYGDYSDYAYAPYGDAAFAGCVISIYREYMGSDNIDLDDYFLDMDETKEFFQENFGDSAYNMEISDYGTTCLGRAVKISFQTMEEDYEDKTEIYIITSGAYAYSVNVIALPDCTVDVFVLAEEILANGIVKE